MKLKCTIGSQSFSDGRVYKEGDEYELDDETTARTLIGLGYAIEIKPLEVVEPVVETMKRKTQGDKETIRRR